MMTRFTINGSDELEQHLAATCQNVLGALQAAVPPSRLEAILLGGGYGRGEGGVLKTETGDRPYNDLEFYVGLRGNRFLNERRYGAVLHRLAEKLSPAAGVDVEFKIFSLDQLRRSPVTMFYYDLVMGHRWVLGNENLLAGCEHHRQAAQIPLSEATRLLMNRCSGLLFALQRLRAFQAEDADFIGRNLAKAQLGFGDVVLTAQGQYHWSCRERQNRWKTFLPSKEMSWLPMIKRHHAAGVEFKLHPKRTLAAASELQAQHAELADLALQLWLWLESRRLGTVFESARDYANSALDKCPETQTRRNRLINVRTFGPSQLIARNSGRYPRERVFHALALLLWEPAALQEPRLLSQLQNELSTSATEFDDLVHAYEQLWRRFN